MSKVVKSERQLQRLKPRDEIRHASVNFQPHSWIVYRGPWERAGSSFDSPHASNQQFSAFELVFEGSVVRWIGSMGPDHGIAKVFIDGTLVETVDAYAECPLADQVKFECSNLAPDRPHKICVRVTKDRNPNATGCLQDISRLEVERPFSFPVEIAIRRDQEYAMIQAGAKPVPDPRSWQPVQRAANRPERGVSLQAGCFKRLFERNIAYLRHCAKSPTLCDGEGWSKWLPASNDGRMLAGAANALRWEADSDLRGMVERIVRRIALQARADGYFDYYPEAQSFALELGTDSERKNYDRLVWTRGLLAAGAIGVDDALILVRRMYDWFNSSNYRSRMLMGGNATNGLPTAALVYHSKIGRPDDLVTALRFYDQRCWMEHLANAEPLAFTYYPGDRPHCYTLLGLEAFIGEYRATGEEDYLHAALGGWKAYRENFKQPGGLTTLMETHRECLPKALPIEGCAIGETCGTVFWINVNEELLELYPSTEAYAGEIEEALFNGLLGAQDESGYIRYHNVLKGAKNPGQCRNTCCEVTATDLIARLPELIYSIAPDGLYVNQFIASTISWSHGGQQVTLDQDTDFPFSQYVRLRLRTAVPVECTIHLRIPAWASGTVAIMVNDELFANARPGTYLKMRRSWMTGDEVRFSLNMSLLAVPYEGVEQASGNRDRAALMYGPLLLALVDDNETDWAIASSVTETLSLLQKQPDSLELHFPGVRSRRYLPYFAVQGECFDCFPIFERS